MSFGLGGLGSDFGRLGAGGARRGSPVVPGVLSAARGSFVLTGNDAGLVYGRLPLTVAAGSFALSGQAAILTVQRTLAAGAGAFTLTGNDAALTKATPGAYALTAGTGAFIYSGDTMTPLVDYRLPADVGAFALTGQDATLTKSSGGYTGPGDLRTFAIWGGVRGYSAAYAAPGTNPALDLVDQAGANSVTIPILSNGNLDIASVSAWVTAHSVTTIKVAQLYDQTGNGRHLAEITLANMPVLTLSTFGSIPCMTFAGAQRLITASVTLGLSQPYMVSTVVIPSIDGTMSTVGAGNLLIGFSSGVLKPRIYAGASDQTTVSSTIGAKDAVNYVVNGASSVIRLNGASATVAASPGAVDFTAANNVFLGNDIFSEFFTGNIAEAGIETWTSGDETAIETNQRSYYGF